MEAAGAAEDAARDAAQAAAQATAAAEAPPPGIAAAGLRRLLADKLCTW